MNNKNELSVKPFGELAGESVQLYRLSNGHIELEITNYGCTIVSAFTPDKFGNNANIVSGFSNFASYLQNQPYMGCVVGRFANRIAHGRLVIDGHLFSLPLNDGANHLHGGFLGFNQKVWNCEHTINDTSGVGVCFSYHSKNGEEGYPGNLLVWVTYLLNQANELHIQYKAVTDAPTIVSLTNHSYFNLSGFEEETIHNHYLQINADNYTPKTENNTPSGAIAPVNGTALDFRSSRQIGEKIDELVEDMGYDHNFVLHNNHREVEWSARLFHEPSGRSLQVSTNQPGMQVYTANWWNGTLTGSQNKPYQKHGAVALETQAFPDAPNHPGFPSAVLRPGETYNKRTIVKFN